MEASAEAAATASKVEAAETVKEEGGARFNKSVSTGKARILAKVGQTIKRLQRRVGSLDRPRPRTLFK